MTQNHNFPSIPRLSSKKVRRGNVLVLCFFVCTKSVHSFFLFLKFLVISWNVYECYVLRVTRNTCRWEIRTNKFHVPSQEMHAWRENINVQMNAHATQTSELLVDVLNIIAGTSLRGTDASVVFVSWFVCVCVSLHVKNMNTQVRSQTIAHARAPAQRFTWKTRLVENEKMNTWVRPKSKNSRNVKQRNKNETIKKIKKTHQFSYKRPAPVKTKPKQEQNRNTPFHEKVAVPSKRQFTWPSLVPCEDSHMHLSFNMHLSVMSMPWVHQTASWRKS